MSVRPRRPHATLGRVSLTSGAREPGRARRGGFDVTADDARARVRLRVRLTAVVRVAG